ncbi:MAG: hypothetical protein AABW50_02725 [Nanoarchaeota archaeon]
MSFVLRAGTYYNIRSGKRTGLRSAYRVIEKLDDERLRLMKIEDEKELDKLENLILGYTPFIAESSHGRKIPKKHP